MTDSNTVQCIPITIVSDSTTETSDECFTYTISATSSVAGLTLSPTTATICIRDEEESKLYRGDTNVFANRQTAIDLCFVHFKCNQYYVICSTNR